MADEAQRGLKDRELQAYYEGMQEMFTTPGWKSFIEDMRKLFEAADSIVDVKNGEDLKFRQGQIHIINYIVTREAVLAAAYETLLEEDDFDAPLAV